MAEQKRVAITPETSVIIRRVARQLARIANERGWNLGQLAEQAGVSYAFMQRLMDGKQNLTILTLEDICERLDVPIEIMLVAYLHPEPEAEALKTRWGARRAAKARMLEDDGRGGGTSQTFASQLISSKNAMGPSAVARPVSQSICEQARVGSNVSGNAATR